MAPHSSAFSWKIPWMEEPGRLQSMGSLESDTTERLHFHFLLSCIGEGNGNPLQCSCLENPRDGGAWWAAVYGVTQSRTRVKRLSSSSSSSCCPCLIIEDDSLKKFVKFLLRLVWWSREVEALLTGDYRKHIPSGRHIVNRFFCTVRALTLCRQKKQKTKKQKKTTMRFVRERGKAKQLS